MARRALAALADTLLALLIVYGAFRAAAWSAHCQDQSQCVILTPLILTFIIVGLGLFFAVPLWALEQTVGQWLFGTGESNAGKDGHSP